MADVRHALRKPRYRKQAARVEELLVMDVELKKARNVGVDNFEEYANDQFEGGSSLSWLEAQADPLNRPAGWWISSGYNDRRTSSQTPESQQDSTLA
jgi:hypothetical protein